MEQGKVFLVGGGPGHAGLLTLKARRCLETADVIVYDRLVSPRLLNYARADAKLIYAGKDPHGDKTAQDAIDELLVRLARAGKSVVRLKGGDPFVFGRGGEEALALEQAGIPWEVVPGVTSAVSVPAYAGIPVTHRGAAAWFTVVTGHRADGLWDAPAAAACSPSVRCLAAGTDAPGVAGESKPGPKVVAQNDGTLVILMGVHNLPRIADGLIRAGRDPQTPVAVIRCGTQAGQQVVRGVLADIAERVRALGVKSPAVIVVGAVAELCDRLAWAERQPLFGRRLVAIGHTQEQAAAMADELEALGAEVLDIALERAAVVRPSDVDTLVDAVLRAGGGRRAVCFSTPLGVHLFFARWRALGLDVRRLAAAEFAAGCPEVADALQEYGVVADVVDDPPEASRDREAVPIRLKAWSQRVVRHGGRLIVEGLSDVAAGRLGVGVRDGWEWRRLYDWTCPAQADAWQRWASEGVDGVWAAGPSAWTGLILSGLAERLRLPEPDWWSSDGWSADRVAPPSGWRVAGRCGGIDECRAGEAAFVMER
ncbi:MAG: uroporphyrinogen-III C-methyltransferase [Alicyclobacillaceae bacterium]|nr:uroporphyrinogen-III C-methyltransferase [Alicyclobacillaceae bacterium]